MSAIDKTQSFLYGIALLITAMFMIIPITAITLGERAANKIGQ